MSKNLVAYYSRASKNYFGGSLKVIDKGNTEYAAEIIAMLTGGELFKIDQKTPYSDDYKSVLKQAKFDQQKNIRPELTGYPDSIAEYDTIYLGYPNYWGTMPMAVFTFLEKHDFSGKTIMPFCTHEGSITELRIALLQYGICLPKIKDPARELERYGTSHKDLQRERKQEFHKHPRPYRHKVSEHVNAALCVDCGQNAVRTVYGH